jgi:hypothetical protein
MIDYEVNGKDKSLTTNNLLDTKPAVWICPSNTSHGWGYNDLSYGFNVQLGYYRRDNSVITQKVRVQAVRRPSGIIMLGDGDGDKEYDAYIDACYYTVGYLHNMGSNLVFIDQHAEWMAIRDACRPGVYYTGTRWTGGSDTEKSMRLWGKAGRYANP